NIGTKIKPGDKLLDRSITPAIDLNEFNDVYEQARLKAIADIYNENHNLPSLNEAKEWLQQVIDYNVGKGKRNRARICWLAYRQLCPSESMNDEKNLQIGILSFCLELMQSYFLIFDDIMDDSITRRGQDCWYRKNGIGMIAINDGKISAQIPCTHI
ncbi:farnesyl pyrophosphate synthase-like protein, partial [Euroglyphus maynei]